MIDSNAKLRSIQMPFCNYRNTDRIVTILLALIIVVLLTTVSVSVYILCSW